MNVGAWVGMRLSVKQTTCLVAGNYLILQKNQKVIKKGDCVKWDGKISRGHIIKGLVSKKREFEFFCKRNRRPSS